MMRYDYRGLILICLTKMRRGLLDKYWASILIYQFQWIYGLGIGRFSRKVWIWKWMRKMVNMWEWWMGGLGNVSGFQAMNFRRTLVVSFQLLLFFLGGRDCGISKRQKRWVERILREVQLGRRLICIRFLYPILSIVFFFILWLF